MAKHSIIPEPVSYVSKAGVLVLNKALTFRSNASSDLSLSTLMLFKNHLNSIGFETNLTADNNSPIIEINVDAKYKLADEGYELEVHSKGLEITVSANSGLFNAIQTLKQLLPAAKTNSKTIKIPCCVIKDYPRFQWRGLMLDVSRHFFTVKEVKSYLDVMANYKFNVFHWHLTDDNGWRIEIKSLPKLTEVGAWRVERHGRFGAERTKPTKGEKAIYGGFYTHQQIKDVVQYAAALNITIVPEIDVPGHSMSLLAAYPELSTLKEDKLVSPGHKFAVWQEGGAFKMSEENTLDPTNERVYEFIDKIFTEVAELFPGQYIHMGGDECYKGFWEQSETVNIFMKINNIKDTSELQSYFIRRVQEIITKKGKKMIGWDEITEGGLSRGAAVMSWQGMKRGVYATKAGHEVVMSPTTYAYLDYQQGDTSVENSIYAKLTLEKSYEFEPVPEGVDSKLVLGGQANLWTEAIPTLQFAYYMTYPRALSIAETVWSPKSKKNWDNFAHKVEIHFDRFAAQGINVCKAVYEPIVTVYEERGKLMCKLENSISGSQMYYSLNNTYPVNYANKYTCPFEVPIGKLKLRTQNFKNDQPIGRELIIDREDLVNRAKKWGGNQ